MIPYFEFTEFPIGPLTIKVWGLLFASAIIVTMALVYREARRKQLDTKDLIELVLWIIVSSLLGARLFYVLNEWQQFAHHLLDVLKIWQGGAALYGGYIGAVIASIVYFRIKKQRFWPWADTVLYALPLGIAIGRIGCFLVHDHLGTVTHVPWGIQFAGQTRHETALYSMISALILFFLLRYLRKSHFNTFDGFIATLFMIGDSISRMIIDFFRARDLPFSDPRIYGLTMAQYLAAVLFVVGLVLFFRLPRKKVS